jgi:4'-phosphopantetheinyl transferase
MPGELTLSPGEVQVWQVEHLDGLSQEILTPEERSRAERFHFARDREAFLTTRIVLRELLGRYMGLAPQELQFVVEKRGKPSLAGGGIEFNVSHSGSMSLLAFSREPVGVDLERVKPMGDRDAIVSRYFGVEERRQWATLREAERERAFFLGWTRKEAYLKAVGAGLSLGLDSYDVTLTPGEEARLLNVAGWELYDLAADGYAAALAVKGTARQIRGWRLTRTNLKLGDSIAAS